MHLKIFCLCLIIGPTFFQTKSIYYCDYYCSISIFGHEIWNLKKRSQSWMCTLFLPQGGQIKLIFALREAVFEIRAIFKISIFGHEIRKLKKGPKSCICTLFLPQMVEIKHIFVLQADVSEIQAVFQNFHDRACDLELKKDPKVAYVLYFYPRGVKMSLALLYGQWLSRYGSFST